MLYGTSKSIVEHLHEKDAYHKVRKVYSINIVYFDLGIGDDYVYHGISNFTGLHTHNELQLDDQQKECLVLKYVDSFFVKKRINNGVRIESDVPEKWQEKM
jgi:hypothetical protein